MAEEVKAPRAPKRVPKKKVCTFCVDHVDGLENIDPKKQAVRIGGTVGTKKRMAIEDRADELGIRVLNRMV